MNCCKKLLMNVACVSLMLGNTIAIADDTTASEEDNKNEFSSKIASGESVVLYKIHDIKSLKNETDDASECEFSLTLYNRSPKTIESATIQLSWEDDSIEQVIDKENRMDIDEEKPVNEKLAEMYEQANPKTETLVSKYLSTSVILPKIKPFRQVSLKSRVRSDRCFLMMEDVDASFPVCSVIDGDSGNSSGNLGIVPQGANDCVTLFRFVSPKDPEYYREFQKVSFNEEADRHEEEVRKSADEVEMQYNKILQSVNGVTAVLESIK